jgi:hypothetical protein
MIVESVITFDQGPKLLNFLSITYGVLQQAIVPVIQGWKGLPNLNTLAY